MCDMGDYPTNCLGATVDVSPGTYTLDVSVSGARLQHINEVALPNWRFINATCSPKTVAISGKRESEFITIFCEMDTMVQ